MHGWGGEIASFRFLADRLSPWFRVTLIDLYGFGQTPHPDYPLCIDDYSRGVAQVLDETGGGEAVLVGHSFGGRVSMRLAANEGRVRGLVLIDSAGVIPRRGPSYFLKIARYKLAKKIGKTVLPKGSADYNALSDVMRGTFVNVVNENSLRDAKRIKAPTILIWGSEDKDTPLYMCEKLNRAIRGSEKIVYEGAGHFSYLDRPDLTMRIIKTFAEGI